MKKNLPYIGLIIIQSIFYGILDPISKTAYTIIPTYTFLLLRYLTAISVMLLFFGKNILTDIKVHKVKDWIIPALCIGSSLIISNTGLNFTLAANISFVRSLSAIIVPVLMFVFFKKKIRKHEYLLFAIILVGLYLLCGRGGIHSWGLGETLAFIAAILGAGALAFGQSSLKTIKPMTLSFLQASVAAVLCLATGAVTGNLQFATAAQPSVLLTIGYAAIFCTLGGFLLQNIALRHISAKVVGMTQCLYPICSAFFAAIIIKEMLTVPAIIGCALISCAVFAESFIE